MALSNVRYEALPSEEENVAAESVSMTVVAPPPEYSENAGLEQEGDVPAYMPAKLPNYVEATSLPTYEEAERNKAEEEATTASCSTDIEGGQVSSMDGITGVEIGTDGMFICTFFLSFLFYWLGFLLSLCLTNTIAGRCGALAGLGLSTVKWVLIAAHNNWVSKLADADSWLRWLLIICGIFLFVRGCVQYIRVKYEWSRVNGQLRHFRLI